MFLVLLLSLTIGISSKVGDEGISEKCSKCMRHTQKFLNFQKRYNISAYDICEKATVCAPRTAVKVSEIARLAIRTSIRDTLAKIEAEETAASSETIDNAFEGTEEVLALFDKFYNQFNDAIQKAIEEGDVKATIKEGLKRIKREKKLASKENSNDLGFSPTKRFWLWLGEVVLNNQTLNRLAKEGFEWLFGVTVDAE